MRCFFFLLLAGVGFSSCSPQNKEIKFSSPEGDVEIRVSGERTVQFDPWKVTVAVAAYGREEAKFSLEMQIRDLTEEYVSWDWQTGQKCLVSFKHADGELRNVRVMADEKFTHIKEVFTD